MRQDMSNKQQDKDDCINELTKQVSALAIQVKALQKQSQSQGKNNATLPEEQVFPCIKIGDRVQMLNTFKNPKNWDNTHLWMQSGARKGTVSCLSGD